MKLPKELTTVTKLSKYLAMLLFIALPIVGFLLGTKYQQKVMIETKNTNLSISQPVPTPSWSIIRYKSLTPIKTLSSGWKTYNAPANCFSFSIPGNWEVTYDQTGKPKSKDCYLAGIFIRARFMEGANEYYFTSSIGQGGRGLAPNEYVVEKPAIISGHSYSIITITYYGQSQPYDIIAFPDAKYFKVLPAIGMRIPSTNTEHYLNLFDQILATFRFSN